MVDDRKDGGEKMNVYQCPGCGYRYDETAGEPHEGLAAGTRLDEVPEDLSCPDCGVRDFVDFEPVEAT
jgi:rubredoxin